MIIGITLLPLRLAARLVPVQYKQGTFHGFIVLRSQEGQTLATGDMIQTVEGENVTSELVLHFKDGSIYDDVSVFSQNKDFRLISDHVRQEGKSFSNPVECRDDVARDDVEIASDKEGNRKVEHHQVQIPEDVANGLILTLVENIPPSEPETTVSLVSESSNPRVVKLKIHSEGKQSFSASGERLEATHYVIHTDIGGAARAVAKVVGKQPADIHFWIVDGKAPAFVKFTGQLFNGGPVWNIELAAVKWENNASARETH
jgi:hypothetical protein